MDARKIEDIFTKDKAEKDINSSLSIPDSLENWLQKKHLNRNA